MFRHEQCLITDVPHPGPLQRTVVEVALVDRVAVGEALCLVERAHHGTHNEPVRLEEFGWFGGMLEEFVREKHCSG